LAESKNASVVRKTFGYSHIEQHWADELLTHFYFLPMHTDAFLLSANALSLLCLERDLVCQCAVY
jgi:hypothetical protein